MLEVVLHIVLGFVVGLLNNRSWTAFAALYCGVVPERQRMSRLEFVVLKMLVVCLLVLYFSYFGATNLLVFTAGFFLAFVPLFFKRLSGNTK